MISPSDSARRPPHHLSTGTTLTGHETKTHTHPPTHPPTQPAVHPTCIPAKAAASFRLSLSHLRPRWLLWRRRCCWPPGQERVHQHGAKKRNKENTTGTGAVGYLDKKGTPTREHEKPPKKPRGDAANRGGGARGVHTQAASPRRAESENRKDRSTDGLSGDEKTRPIEQRTKQARCVADASVCIHFPVERRNSLAYTNHPPCVWSWRLTRTHALHCEAARFSRCPNAAIRPCPAHHARDRGRGFGTSRYQREGGGGGDGETERSKEREQKTDEGRQPASQPARHFLTRGEKIKMTRRHLDQTHTGTNEDTQQAGVCSALVGGPYRRGSSPPQGAER